MCRCHGEVFCASTALAIVANEQLGTTRYIVILCLYSAFRFPIFQDGGRHDDDDCNTLMMIASSVANTLMMIASSVGRHFDDDRIFGRQHFDDDCIFCRSALWWWLHLRPTLLKKSFDFDLALDDFPYWLLCVLLEDSIWALGSCVHVCLLKIIRRSPILKNKILFTCADVMVRCFVL